MHSAVGIPCLEAGEDVNCRLSTVGADVFHALANGGNKVAGEHVEAGTQLGAGTAAG
jgi:hypothetical protein